MSFFVEVIISGIIIDGIRNYFVSYLTHSVSLKQILNPNPDAMSKMITENASEEFLYSLSNYCALQVVLDSSLLY